jgi:general stress protein 26
METYDPERLLEVARAVMHEAGFCFLITIGGEGHPHARVMQPFEPEEDLIVWFGASPNSRKVREIRADPRVTLGYSQEEEGAYVTLLGQASVVSDIEERRRRWRESFRAFWPEGAESENYTLLRFVPERIELMHIEKSIAPPPFGLRPAVLTWGQEGWSLEESAPSFDVQ